MSLLEKLAAEGRRQKADGIPALQTAATVTPIDAERARDRAIEQVDKAASSDWKAHALECIHRTAEALPEFISDDVWEHGLESTFEDRALGPIFQKAAREGWISKTDRVRPSVRSHLSGKTVWRSLIYREAS